MPLGIAWSLWQLIKSSRNSIIRHGSDSAPLRPHPSPPLASQSQVGVGPESTLPMSNAPTTLLLGRSRNENLRREQQPVITASEQRQQLERARSRVKDLLAQFLPRRWAVTKLSGLSPRSVPAVKKKGGNATCRTSLKSTKIIEGHVPERSRKAQEMRWSRDILHNASIRAVCLLRCLLTRTFAMAVKGDGSEYLVADSLACSGSFVFHNI